MPMTTACWQVTRLDVDIEVGDIRILLVDAPMCLVAHLHAPIVLLLVLEGNAYRNAFNSVRKHFVPMRRAPGMRMRTPGGTVMAPRMLAGTDASSEVLRCSLPRLCKRCDILLGCNIAST